jgi:poly(3-hydroxybutyrate) depolymerase
VIHVVAVASLTTLASTAQQSVGPASSARHLDSTTVTPPGTAVALSAVAPTSWTTAPQAARSAATHSWREDLDTQPTTDGDDGDATATPAPTTPALPTSVVPRPPTTHLRACPRRGVSDDIAGIRLVVPGHDDRPTVLSFDGAPTDPLIVVFHGQNGCIEMVQSQLDLDDVGPSHHLNVLWLSGAPPPRRSWNTNGRCCDPASTAGVDDYTYVAAAVQTAVATAGLRPRATIAVGMSNGAGMAVGAACRFPTMFDVVVSVAGWVPFTCHPMHTSLVTVGGSNDEVLGADVAAHNAATWRHAVLSCTSPGATVRFGSATITTWLCADSTFVELVQLNGVGHVWPTYDFYDADEELLRLAAELTPSAA